MRCALALAPSLLLMIGSDPAWGGTATAAVTVDTEIAASCTFTSAPDFRFGTVSLPLSARTLPATLVLQCSAGAPWSLRIDQGQNYATTLRMARAGSGATPAQYTLAYEMCADAVCNTPLTSTLGPDGVGTGNAQPVVIAARLLAAQSPPPGDYNDLLTVRIDY